MSGKEQMYVKEAFASNSLAPLGPHLDSFEGQFQPTLVKICIALV